LSSIYDIVLFIESIPYNFLNAENRGRDVKLLDHMAIIDYRAQKKY
jgi:hypothetical protein